MQEARQWEPGEPAQCLPWKAYSQVYWDPLESILESISPPWSLFWGLLGLLAGGPTMGARRPSLATIVQDSLEVYSGVHWTPWSQFWNLLRLLGRVPAVGARRPSLATIVQDSLGVYSGVYWSHGLYSGIYWDLLDYSGVYWVSLESIQESIGAPSRRPDSGSHESQPGAHRLARRSSLAPWSLF